jgi:eukaryotic-like serine/threonine-protein kinase
MRECPACFRCFDDTIIQCPDDARVTFHSIPGDPTIDNRYLLERRLGEGGMGIVYKALHKFLKITRAVKVIKSELVGGDSSFATRFQQEAMAAAAIGHSNIISVFDYGFLGGDIPYLVMEFIEGNSLQDLMTREGKFSPEKALEYVSVIGSGVGAAHRHGIVHRDLKPLNIMMHSQGSPRDSIRILDFGLAKIKAGDMFGSFVGAKTTGVIGSPYYMAPEQWSDEESDSRCDIYSLGIILHQMLTGDVPFKGSSIPAVMTKHLMAPPPPLADASVGISDEIERVVHHALQKDPKARTASVEDLIRELEQAVLGVGAAARRAGTDGRAVAQPRPISTSPTTSTAGRITAEQKTNEAAEHDMHLSTTDEQGSGRTTQTEAAPPIEGITMVYPSAVPKVEDLTSVLVLEPELIPSTERIRISPLPKVAERNEAPPLSKPVEMPLRKRVEAPPPKQERQGGSRMLLLIGAGVATLALVLVVVGILTLNLVWPSSPATPRIKPSEIAQAPAREMVLINGGTFTMGADEGIAERRPAHQAAVASFYFDETEVTNAEYSAFLKATGHAPPLIDDKDPYAKNSYWKPWNGSNPPSGRERWPVCNVTVQDAEDFAQWLSKRDGARYRLPTEEEWEFAARNGSTDSLFPWGNSWSEGRANLGGKTSPTAVGSYPDGKTQRGLQDMIGNVWEWTSTRAAYYDKKPVPPEAVTAYVFRGGSFAEKVDSFANATDRAWYRDEQYKFPAIGFRLARDAQ